jgi:hypothetical protein
LTGALANTLDAGFAGVLAGVLAAALGAALAAGLGAALAADLVGTFAADSVIDLIAFTTATGAFKSSTERIATAFAAAFAIVLAGTTGAFALTGAFFLAVVTIVNSFSIITDNINQTKNNYSLQNKINNINNLH